MKKAISLLLALVLCLSLCACSGGNDTSKTKGIEETTPTENLNETTEIPTESETESPAETIEQSESTQTSEPVQDGSSSLWIVRNEIIDMLNSYGEASLIEFVETCEYPEFNQQVRIDNLVEFTLQNVYQADTITPSNPNSFYNYYEANSGEIFIVIEGTVTNLSTDTLDFGASSSCSNAIANLIVNGNNIYGGNYVLEKADLSDITGELDPEQTSSLRLIFSVPTDVANDLDSMYLLIGFGNLVDNLVMGFGNIYLDKCTHRFVIEVPAQ